MWPQKDLGKETDIKSLEVKLCIVNRQLRSLRLKEAGSSFKGLIKNNSSEFDKIHSS